MHGSGPCRMALLSGDTQHVSWTHVSLHWPGLCTDKAPCAGLPQVACCPVATAYTIVIRLALPPAAAVFTLMARSASRISVP